MTIATSESPQRSRRRIHFSKDSTPCLLSPFEQQSSDAAADSDAITSSDPGESLDEQLPDELVSIPTSRKSKWKSNHLFQLSSAQSKATPLRRDRNYWRNRSLQQEARIQKLERDLRSQTRIAADLKSLNVGLEARFNDVQIIRKQLVAGLKGLGSKNKKLTSQLFLANHTAMLLKRSDRAKGKVQQRNLRLKAHMRAHICEDNGRKDALIEALALANERIEELETAGAKFLDGIEKKNDSEDIEMSKDEEADGENGPSPLEGQLELRSVIEDHTYREQKMLWGDLLEE